MSKAVGQELLYTTILFIELIFILMVLVWWIGRKGKNLRSDCMNYDFCDCYDLS